MKNSMLWLSLAISICCGFLLFVRESEIRKVRAQLALEAQQRAQAAEQLTSDEQKLSLARDDLRRSKLQQMHMEASLDGFTRQQTGNGSTQQKTNTPTVSDFLRRQAVKELMSEEAKAGTAREITSLFKSGLASYLNLDEQQSEKLKTLLTAKSEIVWQQFVLPLLSGEVDENSMAAAGRTIRDALEDNANQLKSMLGEDGMARYEGFSKTQAERESFSKFSPSLDQSGQALSPDQQNQLLAAMTEERQAFNFDQDFGDPLKLDLEHWYDNFTEEKFEHYKTQEQELNARILQRAQGILAPSQVEQLNKFMSDQLLRSELTVRTTMALMTSARQR